MDKKNINKDSNKNLLDDKKNIFCFICITSISLFSSLAKDKRNAHCSDYCDRAFFYANVSNEKISFTFFRRCLILFFQLNWAFENFCRQ